MSRLRSDLGSLGTFAFPRKFGTIPRGLYESRAKR